MNGKQKLNNPHTDDDDCHDVKKTKIDHIDAVNTSNEGKENVLKVYPKRRRTLSVKAYEHSVHSPSSTTKTHKKSETIPVKSLLSPSNITESIENPQSSTEDVTLNMESTTKLAIMRKSTTKRVPAKPNKTVKSTNVAQDDNKKKTCLPKTVNKRLEQMGIDAGSVSFCVKAAMCKGFISITGDASDLEQVIYKGDDDGHTYNVLLKDVLYQSDYGGDGSEDATVLCVCCPPDDSPERVYITRLCKGQPELDCGKFHNHCRQCVEGFGVCINDYRMAHCDRCNKHWYQGLTGFPCDNCKRIRQQSRSLTGLYMDSDNSDSDEAYNPQVCSIF